MTKTNERNAKLTFSDTMTFAFNVTFTREDENHANVYTVGFNVMAKSMAEAEPKLASSFSHLKVSKVELFAVLDEDGDVVVSSGPIEAYGVKGLQSKPWRKTFKNANALNTWVEKNDAEVYASRTV